MRTFPHSYHQPHTHFLFSTMATTSQQQQQQPEKPEEEQEDDKKLLSSYLRLSFTLFLVSLPKSSISIVTSLQSQTKSLSARLFEAEEELKFMRSTRKEDSKANARVVEIFASQRNSWQMEEKRLHHQIDASAEEIARLQARVAQLGGSEAELKARVDELRREVSERDEMINFMSRRTEYDDEGGGGGGFDEYNDGGEKELRGCRRGGERYGAVEDGRGGGGGEECYLDPSRFGKIRVSEEECYLEREPIADEIGVPYGQYDGFSSDDLLASASKFWSERPNHWQDVQYESHESLYHMKHFVARRESPWKVEAESAGVSSKLKSLEQELLNFERIGKSDISKIPSLMRKQAKRYQALAGKIDDLCRKMQASDPSEPTLTSEFRTQRQTEFLLEAFRLQQRASETGQKLTALQTETGKSYLTDEYGGQGKLTTRRSLDSIRNNFKEIQRNLEIWLARIIGDLEGILARDGASRVREYYISRYPFVQ